MPKKKTHEEFLCQIRDKPVDVLGVYDGVRKKIQFKCKIDGNVWTTAPNVIIHGSGCPVCGMRGRLRDNQVVMATSEYVVIDTSTEKHKGAVTILDVEDWSDISRKYSGMSMRDSGYVGISIGGSRKLLHRVVMPDVAMIDHINGLPYDNRKSNLRSCTQMQNSQNQTCAGVSFCKRSSRWIAQLVCNGEKVLNSRFANKQDAIDTRRCFELRYFGEFAKQPIGCEL